MNWKETENTMKERVERLRKDSCSQTIDGLNALSKAIMALEAIMKMRRLGWDEDDL